jgi:hypothetical protein
MDARLHAINFNSNVQRSSDLIIEPSSFILAKPKINSAVNSLFFEIEAIENLSKNPNLDTKITVINPLQNLGSSQYLLYEVTGIDHVESFRTLDSLTYEPNKGIVKDEIMLILQQLANFLQEQNLKHTPLTIEDILYSKKGDEIKLYFLNSLPENFSDNQIINESQTSSIDNIISQIKTL